MPSTEYIQSVCMAMACILAQMSPRAISGQRALGEPWLMSDRGSVVTVEKFSWRS